MAASSKAINKATKRYLQDYIWFSSPIFTTIYEFDIKLFTNAICYNCVRVNVTVIPMQGYTC